MEIAHLAKVLGRSLDDIPQEGPGAEELPQLRRVLFGLDAVLKLHFAQEKESYLALRDVEKAAHEPYERPETRNS